MTLPYPKIQTVFARNSQGRILDDQFSMPEFRYLAENQWIGHEKVDGTNIRILIDQNGLVDFKGRTDKAAIPAPLLQKLREMFTSRQTLVSEIFPDGGCLYGEGYGGRIQKAGSKYSASPAFILFDVRVGDWWLGDGNIDDVAESLALSRVPRVFEGTLAQMAVFVKSKPPSELGNLVMEGIVARPNGVDLFTRKGERVVTKLKVQDFRTEQ